MLKPFLLMLACAAALANPAVRAAPAPLLPVEDVFRKPATTAYAISPDGEHVAWLEPWSTRLNLFVRTLGQDSVTQLTHVVDRDIAGFFWEGNDELVFSRDSGGDENFHLYGVRREGGIIRDLTPFPGVRALVVDKLEEQDDRVLVAMNRRDPKVFDVYRLTPSDGRLEPAAENPGNIAHWLADHDGRIRAAYAEDGLNRTLLYRDDEKSSFRALVQTDFRTEVLPLAFTFDNRRLYVLSNQGRDRLAAMELDPVHGTEKYLYEEPGVDVAGILLSRHRKRLEGVSFIADRLEYAFVDPARAHVQRYLEERLPGLQVSVENRSRDEGRLIVRAASDRNPSSYYLYEVDIQKLEKLADTAPWLKPEQLAEMRPMAYKARDGRLIHGYLTLPAGVEPRNLPAVINPHGGPDARDAWGYDPEAQFLANRGYAVLQANFRGSTGYGREFWEAGFRQWGRGAMQNDLSDSVQWLVGQGIADPKRIAIYGGSYGGYASLAGLAFTPELYAAGVSYVGPSNLFTLFASLPPYWELGRQEWYAKVGDPEKDKDLLTAISPYFHADQIRAPLFVAQGANDPRVKKAESDQIVAALRKRGIAVSYMVRENEGHGFRNEENRLDFYRVLEAFLAEHLKGRSSTDPGVLKALEKH